MESLIHELKSLESWNMPSRRYLNNIKDTNSFRKAVIDRKINRICSMLCDLLITADGECDWDNIEILCDNGYYVEPREQDRFGWLTAILVTKKGDIIYG